MAAIHLDPHDVSLTPDWAGASYWLATAGEDLVARASLEGDLSCDVAIAGVGFTGLWTAYFLKKAAPDLDIVMLDAAIAGYGASGRNGGWCAGELLHLEEWLDDPQTRPAAQRLQRQMFQTVEQVGAIARAEDIDCHFRQDGMMTVALSVSQQKRLEDAAAKMARAGFGDAYELLDSRQMRARIANDAVEGGLFSPHCAALHPARLARGLAYVLERKGVRIFERSAVRDIAPGRLSTKAGSLRAETCVLACEGYTSGLRGFARALAPLHSRMIATAPLSDAQWGASGLSSRACFGDANRMVSYGQVTADRRIAFGARGDYRFASRIEDRIARGDPCIARVRARLKQVLPVLGDIPITHAWTGPLGLTRARKPFVFFDKATRFGWAGGYLGQGVAASCLAGSRMSGQILDDAHDPDDLLIVQRPPRPFEPEPLRWAGITAYRTWLSLRDRLER